MEISARHRRVYDQLAGEYERRAESLRPVTEQALADLIPLLRPGARVLDLGCGAGLVSQTLAEAGFETVAIDLSPRMVDLTSRRSPATAAICADYRRHRFGEPFDAAVAFAFIHLFPAGEAARVMAKLQREIVPGGLLYIGTTESARSSEGWEEKADYDERSSGLARFRKRWTQDEFLAALAGACFEPLLVKTHADPFGKHWLDVVCLRPPTCTISGSMRRFLPQMETAAEALACAGVKVRSPRGFSFQGEQDGFVFVDGDDEGSPSQIRARHLRELAAGDFLWLCCPGGYVGRSAATEIRRAQRLDIPVYAQERPQDAELAQLVTLVAGPAWPLP